MIKVYVNKYEIYFKIEDKISYYKFEELEKELENILEDLMIENKSKIFLIIDFEAEDIEFYQNIFSFYKLNIKYAIYFKDVIKKTNKEIIYIGEESSLKIKGNTEEVLNIKKRDNFDFEGIEFILIDENSIDDVFELVEKYKVKNILDKNNFETVILLAILSITILISYTFLSYIYNVDNIDKEIKKLDFEIISIKQKINDINIQIENIDKEIEKNDNNDNILNVLSKKEEYKVIEHLINLNNKGFQFKNIEYDNQNLLIEGVLEDFYEIEKNLNEFKLEYLLSYEDKISYKILEKFNIE